jgi:hypothetical protein
MRRIKELLKNYFRHFLFLVRVEGESGWPYLVPGKRYFASGFVAPRVGDWAVFENPRDRGRILIKRVKASAGGKYIMEGAVSWGSSSRDFGLVERRFVLGRVWI